MGTAAANEPLPLIKIVVVGERSFTSLCGPDRAVANLKKQ